jgi:hypothetical protein
MGKLKSFPILPGSRKAFHRLDQVGPDLTAYPRVTSVFLLNGPGAASGWPPPRSRKFYYSVGPPPFVGKPDTKSIRRKIDVFAEHFKIINYSVSSSPNLEVSMRPPIAPSMTKY